MNHRNVVDLCVPLLLGVTLSGPAHGLKSDADQPIDIEADSAVMDEKEGVAVYQGGVIVTQGSIRIQGDKVTVYTNDEDAFDRALVEGRPARFRQLPDGEEEYIRARARTMEYFATKNLLHLITEAQVTQGGDVFSGARIDYDTERHRVKARGSTTTAGAATTDAPRQRVRITLQPQKDAGSD